VFVSEGRWSWAGVTFDQVDHFFLVRVPGGLHIWPEHVTEMEAQTMLGHRWWRADELRATDDTLEPAELADVLGRLADAGALGG
jgi:hypothetical protein